MSCVYIVYLELDELAYRCLPIRPTMVYYASPCDNDHRKKIKEASPMENEKTPIYTRKKICPIMTARINWKADCEADKCAFWDDSRKPEYQRCVIRSIGEIVTAIYRTGPV